MTARRSAPADEHGGHEEKWIKATQPGVDLEAETGDPEYMDPAVDGQIAYDWMWIEGCTPEC